MRLASGLMLVYAPFCGTIQGRVVALNSTKVFRLQSLVRKIDDTLTRRVKLIDFVNQILLVLTAQSWRNSASVIMDIA